MSINGALLNALSGLTAASRAAEVVSSNISNALTEGYGRRDVSLSSQNLRASGGVVVNGITRHINPVTLAERRLADAELGQADALSTFRHRLETLLGTPADAGSLSGHIADFESSLVAAAGSPGNQTRLQTLAQAAGALAGTFNAASDGVQTMREEADRAIGTMVGRLNTLLSQAEELNVKISTAINQGQDTSALEDDRQRVVDLISELVPVRQVARDRGAVALYTGNGAILLDGSAAEIGFSETPTILPHMTVGNGLLSGLTLNGLDLRTDLAGGALSGGALGAQFAIRDELATDTQAQLDAAARNLVERFQDPALDPTLAPGQAGLLTDGGGAFDAVNEVGLAGRLRLNALVDPDGAGEVWRLRDGLGAAAPGDAGDASLLNALSDALIRDVVPASGGFGTAALSAAELANRLLSRVSADRVTSDEALSFAATRQSALETMELSEGVDTDHEMQQLMLIEQAYAANARMVQTVDEMMDILLRL